SKKEAAKLNGTWIVESAEGAAGPVADLKDAKFVFADGKITSPDSLALKGAPFTVDAGKDPSHIDIKKGEKKFAGIYKLEGDKLHLCADLETAGERPTAFDAKKAVY